MKNSIFLRVLSISISILALENSPSLAGCSLFGCSQSSVAECNVFGCPNPPLGRECTLFGCPGSPQTEKPATTPTAEATTTPAPDVTTTPTADTTTTPVPDVTTTPAPDTTTSAPEPVANVNCPSSYVKPAFGGRTGQIAFFNEWNTPVKVVLYHPSNGQIFDRYVISPKQNEFLGNDMVVGDDWGVCFENNPTASGVVNNAGAISDYNPNWQGKTLFMIQNPRIR
jgi:hypothetical protein